SCGGAPASPAPERPPHIPNATAPERKPHSRAPSRRAPQRHSFRRRKFRCPGEPQASTLVALGSQMRDLAAFLDPVPMDEHAFEVIQGPFQLRIPHVLETAPQRFLKAFDPARQ